MCETPHCSSDLCEDQTHLLMGEDLTFARGFSTTPQQGGPPPCVPSLPHRALQQLCRLDTAGSTPASIGSQAFPWLITDTPQTDNTLGQGAASTAESTGISHRRHVSV
uniref:Uncharacterized protein n=1 Tax=Knipowitschia caucasica TaxID=637954 RepID=A0AAV2MS67_KNICA